MKKLSLFAIVLILVAFIVLAAPALDGTKFENYITGDNTQGNLQGNTWWGQNFRVGETVSVGKGINVSGVNLKLFKTNSPGKASVCIYTVDGNNHPDTEVTCNNTFDVDGLGGTPGAWVNITFPDRQILDDKTNYSIIMNISGSTPNELQWREDTTGSYTGGEAVSSLDAGSSWSKVTASDLMFEIWGDDIFAVFEENDALFNATVYETDTDQAITLNITYNRTLHNGTNVATLYYNGTQMASTRTESGNDTLYTSFVNITDGIGTKNIFWEINFTNSSGIFVENTTARTQEVALTNFTLCDGSNDVPYINYTFADELSSAALRAKIDASTFYYRLGAYDSINKSFTYSIATNDTAFAFCSQPAHRNFTIDSFVQYSTDGYPQRFIEEDVLYTNATTNRTLYLLKTADGLFVTFQVLNTAEQPIQGTVTNASKSIGGATVMVTSGVTDDSGSITFFLDPNTAHIMNFLASGFDILVTTIVPAQSSFTVILGGATTGTVPQQDLTKGITYTILPISGTLTNDTGYNFNITLTSDFWTVTEFGFQLKNASGDQVNSSSLVDNGGITTSTFNTGNNSLISMDYWWVINNTYTNATTFWNVFNTEDSDWSINKFFTDLRTYVTSGMYGLDNFGLAIIVFLVVFITTGVFAFKFGLRSPATITTVLFGLVLIFDVVFDLMDNLNPLPAIPNFPTFIIGLILAGTIFREVTK